jgi:hypothetical protein
LEVTGGKCVFITEQGSYSFNKAGSEFNLSKITDIKDSRIELIDNDNSALNNLTAEKLLMLKLKSD